MDCYSEFLKFKSIKSIQMFEIGEELMVAEVTKFQLGLNFYHFSIRMEIMKLNET